MQNLIKIGEAHPNIAFLYALLGNSFLALLQSLFKYGAQTFTTFQLISIRSMLLIVVNLIVIRSINNSPYIESPQSMNSLLLSLPNNSQEIMSRGSGIDSHVFVC